MIPWDFFLDKVNLKPDELQAHFNRAIFVKDPEINKNQPPFPNNGKSLLQDFQDRLSDLRKLIIDLATPRLEETFRLRAAASLKAAGLYQDFGHCVSLEDFLREYRTGKYDNKMRALVNLLCNQIWGTECFGSIETMIMNKLKLKYVNALVSGDPVKTRRKGGSIKKMIGRMKQTKYIDRFR